MTVPPAPPTALAKLAARSYALPTFVGRPCRPQDRLSDQLGRVHPFTSRRWPDLGKFNANRSVPVAQICLAHASEVLRVDLGAGLLQVWLREYGQPVVQVIPTRDVAEEMTPFEWGLRDLPAATPWRFLWEREASLLAWTPVPFPMVPQSAGNALEQTRLGGFPGLHPDLLEEDWFARSGRQLLLQLGSSAGDRGLIVYYDAKKPGEFDAMPVAMRR